MQKEPLMLLENMQLCAYCVIICCLGIPKNEEKKRKLLYARLAGSVCAYFRIVSRLNVWAPFSLEEVGMVDVSSGYKEVSLSPWAVFCPLSFGPS